jgi:hypothetical protein
LLKAAWFYNKVFYIKDLINKIMSVVINKGVLWVWKNLQV